MGYPTTHLIPAAVLLDNPGITKEEFVELLDQTRCCQMHEFSKYAPWSSFGGKYEDTRNHNGLHGLANILGLSESNKFNEVNYDRVDEFGLYINKPWFGFGSVYRKGRWLQRFEVNVHENNVIDNKVEEVNDWSWDKLKVGSIWQDVYDVHPRAFVEKIIEEEEFKKPEKEQNKEPSENEDEGYEDDEESAPKFKYHMIVRHFWGKHREFKFSTLQKLIAKFPQFDPEFMHDFSQKEGRLSLLLLHNKDAYRWKMVNGRYYLDTDYTFSHIPAGGFFDLGGYTNLVVTAEVIKHKAWKLLSRIGDKHLRRFFRTFPDSRLKYERAVWDSHTSLSAKLQGMNHNDFLRYRMLKS